MELNTKNNMPSKPNASNKAKRIVGKSIRNVDTAKSRTSRIINDSKSVNVSSLRRGPDGRFIGDSAISAESDVRLQSVQHFGVRHSDPLAERNSMTIVGWLKSILPTHAQDTPPYAFKASGESQKRKALGRVLEGEYSKAEIPVPDELNHSGIFSAELIDSRDLNASDHSKFSGMLDFRSTRHAGIAARLSKAAGILEDFIRTSLKGVDAKDGINGATDSESRTNTSEMLEIPRLSDCDTDALTASEESGPDFDYGDSVSQGILEFSWNGKPSCSPLTRILQPGNRIPMFPEPQHQQQHLTEREQSCHIHL